MFKTLCSFDTEFSADSVEWCPIEPFRDTFVCGTYQLTKSEESTPLEKPDLSKRLGRIYLLRATNNGNLTLLQQIEVPAVLDMKWAHVKCQNKILLGVVNSLGYLQIFQLTCETKETLELVTEVRVAEGEEETLTLSLDWCSGRWTDDNASNLKVVVSDSKGSISVIEVSETQGEKTQSWHAHEFEAWIAAFDYWDTNVVYTGGDDCKFQRFDVRVGTSPTIVNRSHDAGVTSIHSNVEKEFSLCSGSYDEILRLWDTRSLRRPVSETNLGGGIWRLKWDPFAHRFLLAACMYGGFRLIDCQGNDAPIVLSDYNEHESISYGCDWSFLKGREISERGVFLESESAALIGTCSFYDHALKLSAVRFSDD